MHSGFCFFLLLLFALFQEWRCAKLLFLFLGGLALALWGLCLPRLLIRRYGYFHRFRSAHAQLGYLDAQILLQLRQVVFPIGYCVCQQIKPSQRRGMWRRIGITQTCLRSITFEGISGPLTVHTDIKTTYKQATARKPLNSSWLAYYLA